MKQKLIDKLKEKGFPIEGHDAPTLSELIENCGNYFVSLERVNFPEGNVFYQAYPTQEDWEKTESYKEYPCVMECCGYESGDTPEEAVAHLWLKYSHNYERKNLS